MPGDLEAARLRLVPSDGEIACPMKGQIAVGRCLQLQGETAAKGRPCTCDVFRARQGTLPKLEVIVEEAPADAIAEVVRKHVEPKAPAPDRRALIAAAAAKKKETTMAGSSTEKMLDAMRDQPVRVFTIAELLKLRGGSRGALDQTLSRLASQGVVRRPEAGQYQIAGGAKVPKPAAAKAPAAEPTRTPPPQPLRATHAA